MFRFSMNKVAQIATETHSFAVKVALGSFVFKCTFGAVFAVSL